MLKRIKTKMGKLLAKSAPINFFRKYGLKLCGYEVGKNVYIGEDLLIITDLSNKECKLKIGDNVSIAPRNIFILSSHANKSELVKLYPPKYGSIVIKKNAWLGTNCVVFSGVTIGESSIVGTNCIISNDVPDFKVIKIDNNYIIKDIRINT